MNKADFSTFSSSKFSTLNSSIEDSRTNKILLDNISTHYIFEDEVHMSFSMLRKYEHLIRANTEVVNVPKEYYYRPEYLSNYLYGTTDFWYLIMFVNNMTSPSEFNRETVLAVNPKFIDIFSKLIDSERKMRETKTKPIPIYKHMLKSLNAPSKQVLPSDFDVELDDLTDLKDYEDVTDDTLNKVNMIQQSSHIIRGKLIGDFYQINEIGRDIFVRKSLCDGFSKADNFKDIGNKLRIIKNGYLKPLSSGTYQIKVYTDANLQMFIDDKSIINHVGDNTLINNPRTKNLFEEYSLNADFKRRNLDYWNVSGASLVYDEEKNKNLLKKNLKTTNLNTLSLAYVDIPASSISFENEGDFIFDIEYFLGNGLRYHKLVQEVIITKIDNTIISYKGESLDYTEINNGLCKARLICPRENLTNSQIKSIRLKLSYRSNMTNINKITDIRVNKFKLFTMEGKTYTQKLDLNKIYKFKSIYHKEETHTDYLNVVWRKDNEPFAPIPENVFYIDYQHDAKYLKNGTVCVEAFNTSDMHMKEQFLTNTLSFDKTFTSLDCDSSVNRFDFVFSCTPEYLKKNLKLVGDSNHKISIYNNGNLLGTKDYTETEKIVDCSSTTINKFTVRVDVKRDSITSLSFYVLVEQNGIYDEIDMVNIFGEFDKNISYGLTSHKFKINRLTGNKRSLYNILCTKNIPNDWILDMEFKNAGGTTFTRKGLFGITFDMKDSSSYYALILRCKGENNYIQSGIYKYDKKYTNMFYDNDFKHEYLLDRMTLMEALDIELDKVDKKIKILKKDGYILLCQDGSRYPFKIIQDMFAPYTEGLLGFFIMNQDNTTVNLTLWT